MFFALNWAACYILAFDKYELGMLIASPFASNNPMRWWHERLDTALQRPSFFQSSWYVFLLSAWIAASVWVIVLIRMRAAVKLKFARLKATLALIVWTLLAYVFRATTDEYSLAAFSVVASGSLVFMWANDPIGLFLPVRKITVPKEQTR